MAEQLSKQDEFAIKGAVLLPTRDQQLEYLGQVCFGDSKRLERLTKVLSEQPSIQGLLTSVDGTVSVDTEVVDPPDKMLGKFRLLHAIGNGGMGTVFLAENAQTNQRVALKVPRAEFLADPHHRKRFINESKLSVKLRHPGLVSVLEVGTEGAVTFIASEYCELGDLSRWLENLEEPVPQQQAALFVAEICDAVAFMHSQGILHLDLKPSNILLRGREASRTDTGCPKLKSVCPLVSDFGVAKTLDTEATKTNTSLIIGTLLYMAPEQLSPYLGRVSHVSDEYSIGIILAQVLGLEIQRDGLSYREILATLDEDAANSTAVNTDGLPNDLRLILSKATAAYPEQRYSSVGELAADLRAFAKGELVAAKPASAFAVVKHWACRKARIKEAWWVCLGCNIVMLVWMVAGITLIFGKDFPGSSRNFALGASIGLIVFNTAPMMILSIIGLRGKRWPILPTLTWVTLVVVVIPVLVLSGILDAIPGMYDKSPFFERLNHYLVLAFGLAQFAALAVAYAAARHQSKQIAGSR